MYVKSLALAALAAAAVSAQSSPSLVEVLQSTPEISNLTTLVSQFPGLARALINATEDLTILAPTNEVFATFLKGPGAALVANNETGLIEGLLGYHVLKGAVPSTDITTTPAFVASVVDVPALTNVTGGQVVELAKNGSDVVAVSGAKSASKVVKAVCVVVNPIGKRA